MEKYSKVLKDTNLRRHKWKDNHCSQCGCNREMRTQKLRMAIVGNKDYFQYKRKYMYFPIGKKQTFDRPNCIDVKRLSVLTHTNT